MRDVNTLTDLRYLLYIFYSIWLAASTVTIHISTNHLFNQPERNLLMNNLPIIPTMPAIPVVPNLPAIPGMPVMPNLPDLP